MAVPTTSIARPSRISRTMKVVQTSSKSLPRMKYKMKMLNNVKMPAERVEMTDMTRVATTRHLFPEFSAGWTM